MSPSYPPPRDERTLPTTTHRPSPFAHYYFYKYTSYRIPVIELTGASSRHNGKFDGIGRLIPLQRDVDFHSLRRRGSRQPTLPPPPPLPLRLLCSCLSLAGTPSLVLPPPWSALFVLCSTYVSRVRNNAKDRGGMRRGTSVGEALLLIVLTGGIFELERARREMDVCPYVDGD